MLAKEPVKEDAIKEESCLAIGPCLLPTKDEEWLNVMRMTLDELEAEYAPHPFPYEGADGFLHSADIHPPQFDFSALGFSSRRLPTPELYPVHGCSPNPDMWHPESSPFGNKPGLLTTGGVIQVPGPLFGFEYVPGTYGKDTAWAMCAT